MKKIKTECDKFCELLGSKNWGDSQINSMNASFYAGAVAAFALFSEISAQENEDIAITQIELLLQDINQNIKIQQAIMERIWCKRQKNH